ncbi:hypothetical protein JW872_03920 [Candidatus Babeliales bacterium]|nr:hypothetical protein [Candidatus Babeliales bacterium]
MKKSMLALVVLTTYIFSPVLLAKVEVRTEAVDTTRDQLLALFMTTRNELGFDDRSIDLTIYTGTNCLGPLGIRVVSYKHAIRVDVHEQFIKMFNDREKRALFGYLLIASIKGIGFGKVWLIGFLSGIMSKIFILAVTPGRNDLAKFAISRAAVPGYFRYRRRKLFAETAAVLDNTHDMISWMKKVEAKAFGEPHRDYHGFTWTNLLIKLQCFPWFLFSRRWLSDDVYYPQLINHLRNSR